MWRLVIARVYGGGGAHIRDVGMAMKVHFEGPCVGIVQYHDCGEHINRHMS